MNQTIARDALVAYLDDYLGCRSAGDTSDNGLQVEGAAEITRLAFAVDACQETIAAAVADGAQMLVVHHGLFWGKVLRVVGPHGRRVRALLDGACSLYAAHLLFPLKGFGLLSLYAYIGAFVLIGLITKNGILMVDFALQRLAEGKNSYDAIYDACMVRFRPILMTGLCAIFGAMPIALGYGADASSRIPLGIIVVGGMAFAQIITLFVTPSIYLYMEQFQERFFKTRTDLE